MFDISWHELLLVAVVTVIVVGPKEIPRVLRTVTGAMRKIRGMAREFQSSIDELAREAELDDLKKSVQASDKFDLSKEVENMIDPTGETEGSLRELKSSVEKGPSALTGDGDDDTKQPDGTVTPESISEAYQSAKTPPNSLTASDASATAEAEPEAKQARPSDSRSTGTGS